MPIHSLNEHDSGVAGFDVGVKDRWKHWSLLEKGVGDLEANWSR